MSAATKEYLGDGVYAEAVEGRIVLTAENGVDIQERIVVEREVLEALVSFADRLGWLR